MNSNSRLRMLNNRARRGVEHIRAYREKHREAEKWSGLESLHFADADNTIVPGCLVLEGGSFRGLYTGGVIDVLMENGINLHTTIGTSAGALNGVNYVSGQIGRAAAVNLGFRHDKRFMGMKSAVQSRGVIGLDFIINGVQQELPLNMERFMDPSRRYIATATNCETGMAMYWEKGKCKEIMKAIQASASLPFLAAMVNVDGIPCLDGGCAVKIPYQWALDEGFEKIIVVRTRPVRFRRAEESLRTKKMAHRIYHHYPHLAELICRQAEQYNTACVALEKLHKEGRILMLCPSEPVHVSAIEGNMEKLGDLYMLGRRDAEAKLEDIRKYLGI